MDQCRHTSAILLVSFQVDQMWLLELNIGQEDKCPLTLRRPSVTENPPQDITAWSSSIAVLNRDLVRIGLLDWISSLLPLQKNGGRGSSGLIFRSCYLLPECQSFISLQIKSHHNIIPCQHVVFDKGYVSDSMLFPSFHVPFFLWENEAWKCEETVFAFYKP